MASFSFHTRAGTGSMDVVNLCAAESHGHDVMCCDADIELTPAVDARRKCYGGEEDGRSVLRGVAVHWKSPEMRCAHAGFTCRRREGRRFVKGRQPHH